MMFYCKAIGLSSHSYDFIAMPKLNNVTTDNSGSLRCRHKEAYFLLQADKLQCH